MKNPTSTFQEYNATLKIKNGKYFFIIPELSLIASGNTVDAAYKELNTKQEILSRQFEEAGMFTELPAPVDNLPWSRANRKKLFMFLSKTVILTAVVAWGILVVAWGIERVIHSNIENGIQKSKSFVKRFAGVEGDGPFWEEFENKLMREQNTKANAPDPFKERKIRIIRMLVKEVKPYTDELSPLLSCPANIKK